MKNEFIFQFFSIQQLLIQKKLKNKLIGQSFKTNQYNKVNMLTAAAVFGVVGFGAGVFYRYQQPTLKQFPGSVIKGNIYNKQFRHTHKYGYDFGNNKGLNNNMTLVDHMTTPCYQDPSCDGPFYRLVEMIPPDATITIDKDGTVEIDKVYLGETVSLNSWF